MQKFILNGIISKEIDYRMTEQGHHMVRLTVRVPSTRKDEQKRRISDFFEFTAWNKTAEIINQFFKKGMPIFIEATLQNHKYNKENVTVYTNNFLINKVDFIPGATYENSTNTD
jgi:single-strand DNA-binding protein